MPLFVAIHIHECPRVSCVCIWDGILIWLLDVFLCLRSHTSSFLSLSVSFSVCVRIRLVTRVCYCDILNVSLSSVCSSAAGALRALHLSSWSLLWGTAMVILIGSHYQTPVGGHGSLVQSRFEGGLKWRIKKCVCVHRFYWWAQGLLRLHVTLVWFMDTRRASCKEMMHAHDLANMVWNQKLTKQFDILNCLLTCVLITLRGSHLSLWRWASAHISTYASVCL